MLKNNMETQDFELLSKKISDQTATEQEVLMFLNELNTAMEDVTNILSRDKNP